MIDFAFRSSPFLRREEIVSTIREQKMVSFDVLARRFRLIPASTLHFDLKQLAKAGFIKKLGSTRGVVYVPNESSPSNSV